MVLNNFQNSKEKDTKINYMNDLEIVMYNDKNRKQFRRYYYNK
jgi:hypothetical protein